MEKTIVMRKRLVSMFVFGALLGSGLASAATCDSSQAGQAQTLLANSRDLPAAQRLSPLQEANQTCAEDPLILLALGSTQLELERYNDAERSLQDGLNALTALRLSADDSRFAGSRSLRMVLLTRLLETQYRAGKRGEALLTLSSIRNYAREQNLDTSKSVALLSLSAELEADVDRQPLTAKEVTRAFKARSIAVEAAPLAVNYRLQFALNSDRLDATAQTKLARIAEGLRDCRKIRVLGHTDTLGSSAYNQELSERRARSVQQALVTLLPALATQISAQGRGDIQPAYPNDNDEHRALNRRVELQLE